MYQHDIDELIKRALASCEESNYDVISREEFPDLEIRSSFYQRRRLSRRKNAFEASIYCHHMNENLEEFPLVSTDVVILNLSNNLISRIPEEIMNYNNMTYLNLSNNLIEELPVDLLELRSLKKIDLSNNPITLSKASVLLFTMREIELDVDINYEFIMHPFRVNDVYQVINKIRQYIKIDCCTLFCVSLMHQYCIHNDIDVELKVGYKNDHKNRLSYLGVYLIIEDRIFFPNTDFASDGIYDKIVYNHYYNYSSLLNNDNYAFFDSILLHPIFKMEYASTFYEDDDIRKYLIPIELRAILID